MERYSSGCPTVVMRTDGEIDPHCFGMLFPSG